MHASLPAHFAARTDPRAERGRNHPVLTVLTIALCAVIGGADSWVEVVQFGKAKREWFAGFLDLSHGIPSHDTFGNVFAALDPDQFHACFLAWVQAAVERAVREHWGIENGLHWVLDVAFRENECRVRVGHAAENFVVVRHLALHLLKGERTAKIGVGAKRLKAGWDAQYLRTVLAP